MPAATALTRARATHWRHKVGRVARRLAALGAAATLGACGGGVFIGVELGGSDDDPPSVALTAVTEAPSGAVVQLAAAASDDFGVDSVSFFRVEAVGPALLLGSDGAEPYQFNTTLPASPSGTVWRYFARAVDGAGQQTDSTPIDITVR